MKKERYFKYELPNLDLIVCRPLDIRSQNKILKNITYVKKIEIKKPRF
jgi:hypothetical protein